MSGKAKTRQTWQREATARKTSAAVTAMPLRQPLPRTAQPRRKTAQEALRKALRALRKTVAALWKQWQSKARARQRSRKLRVCETTQLGDKRFVALIQADGQRFLIGGTSNSITLLATLPGKQPKSFRNMLPKDLAPNLTQDLAREFSVEAGE